MPTKNEPKPKKVVKRKVNTKPKKKNEVRKPVTKKDSIKKTVSKKPSTLKSSLKKTVTAKKKSVSRTPRKKTTKNSDELILPTNVSLRSKAKARAIEMNLEDYIHMSVFKTAYISAFCFILVGSFLTLSTLVPENLKYSQKSEVISGKLGTSTITEAMPLPAPIEPVPESFSFDFMTTLPNEIDSLTEVRLNVTGVQQVTAYLVPKGGFSGPELNLDKINAEVYETFIDPDKFPEGYYEVRVMSQLFDASRKFNIDGPFLLKKPEPEVTDSGEVAILKPVILDDSSVPVEQDVIDETVVTDGNDEVKVEPKQNTETVVKEDILSTGDTNTDSKSILDKDVDVLIKDESVDLVNDDAGLVDDIKAIDEPELLLKRPVLNETNNTIRATVETDGEFKFMELYARRTNSLNEQFVGLAVRSGEDWLFVFNANNLPDGFYQFRARSRLDGKNFVSNGVIFYVSRSSLLDTALEINDLSEDRELIKDLPLNTEEEPVSSEEKIETRRELLLEEEDIVSVNQDLKESEPREFETIDEEELDGELDVNEELPLLTKKEILRREAKEVLRTNADDLNNLLRNYASAVQTGDSTTIDLAKAELESKRRQLVSDGLQNPDTRNDMDEIDVQLEEEINAIKKKVEDFEIVRRQKTETDISIDRDGDGISDFDEENIYNTNPDSADSDNDGFNDSIEILRGFDPLDSEPEVPVQFESPKETLGLVREDVLEIKSVDPVVTNRDRMDSVLPPVRAEIRGKALPNSFVTLFIFSSPTVVTVRTDSDGSFVYTFDKELEDGSHEVYVAVTDNTGSIIAQSSPFSFIKEAEAFSPVSDSGAGAPPTVSSNPVIADTNDFTMVIGMSVISFGVILLLLGMGIRTKKEEELVEVNSEKGWPKVDINNKTTVA